MHGVRLKAEETEISAALWALEAREGLDITGKIATCCFNIVAKHRQHQQQNMREEKPRDVCITEYRINVRPYVPFRNNV